MSQILHLVGPTATGKTKLALHLASIFNGDLISADSRQVYQGMTIGSGQDIPTKAKWHQTDLKLNHQPMGYYQTGSVRIWGYDLIKPNQPWSAAHFYQFCQPLLQSLWQTQKLPIIVGGAGFYHQVLDHPPASLGIQPDSALRQTLNQLSLRQLQIKLKALSASRWANLNASDRQNPRRLIRAIEVILSKKDQKSRFNKLNSEINSLWIGLDLPNPTLVSRINRRVSQRLTQGFEAEFDHLVKTGLLIKNSPAATATGYRQWLAFKSGEIDRTTAITKWQTAELQYAKRQKTWFKAQSHLTWFSADANSLKKLVVQTVKTWYIK